MVLYTKRLILRPWQDSDKADLYLYARDPRIGPPAGWQPHKTEDESLEIIRSYFCAPETYAVCRKEDNRPIGCVGLKMGENTDLTDSEEEAEIGYWLGAPFWGNGLIPEAVQELQRHAFRDLGMKVLWCGYYEGNEKSHRVQQKCGFRYRCSRENVFLPLMNEYRTEHITAITIEEWQKTKP